MRVNLSFSVLSHYWKLFEILHSLRVFVTFDIFVFPIGFLHGMYFIYAHVINEWMNKCCKKSKKEKCCHQTLGRSKKHHLAILHIRPHPNLLALHLTSIFLFPQYPNSNFMSWGEWTEKWRNVAVKIIWASLLSLGGIFSLKDYGGNIQWYKL